MRKLATKHNNDTNTKTKRLIRFIRTDKAQ